ncbi:MAG: hypothetical protein AAFO89_05495 [Planctomycetota bacterium]
MPDRRLTSDQFDQLYSTHSPRNPLDWDDWGEDRSPDQFFRECFEEAKRLNHVDRWHKHEAKDRVLVDSFLDYVRREADQTELYNGLGNRAPTIALGTLCHLSISAFGCELQFFADEFVNPAAPCLTHVNFTRPFPCRMLLWQSVWVARGAFLGLSGLNDVADNFDSILPALRLGGKRIDPINAVLDRVTDPKRFDSTVF